MGKAEEALVLMCVLPNVCSGIAVCTSQAVRCCDRVPEKIASRGTLALARVSEG